MAENIQLYSLATPNGQKVSIALEEMGLSYEAHRIDIMKGEQHTEEFRRINPNEKIPAIVDPDGPNGEPLSIMESGAILIYLAEKSGQFLPENPVARSQTLQWLFFQVGHVGPMFGQFGHFYALGGKESCDHPYPLQRYTNETKRLLGVMETQLSNHDYIAGDSYTIADMAIFPWVGCLEWGYNAREHLSLDAFPKVEAWHTQCAERPAAKRGAQVCPIEPKA